jgi:hypothetical protein
VDNQPGSSWRSFAALSRPRTSKKLLTCRGSYAAPPQYSTPQAIGFAFIVPAEAEKHQPRPDSARFHQLTNCAGTKPAHAKDQSLASSWPR